MLAQTHHHVTDEVRRAVSQYLCTKLHAPLIIVSDAVRAVKQTQQCDLTDRELIDLIAEQAIGMSFNINFDGEHPHYDVLA